MQSYFRKMQSCFRNLWRFNEKNASKLSPELEADHDTHKLAMDFAINIVGLADYVVRVATTQCGYFTDIAYEILRREEEMLFFDRKKRSYHEWIYKKLDFYCETEEYRDFKSVYGEFRKCLKELLLAKQSIKVSQDLYDGKNLATELQTLNAAFKEFYLHEGDVRRLAKRLDTKSEISLFHKMLTYDEVENYHN